VKLWVFLWANVGDMGRMYSYFILQYEMFWFPYVGLTDPGAEKGAKKGRKQPGMAQDSLSGRN